MKQWSLVAILFMTALWMFKPTPADLRAGIYLAVRAWRVRRDARREAQQ